MLDDLILVFFCWVLIGAIIAALSDPVPSIEFAISDYAQRTGKIAPPAWEVFVMAYMVVMWPRVLLGMIRDGK